MKALIEYTVRSRLRDVSTLTVTIEATALPGQTKILKVNDNNIANLQKIEVSFSVLNLNNFLKHPRH
jgi:CD109 antigen